VSAHSRRSEDNAPTRPEDWVGARKVLSCRRAARPPRGHVTFHLYRSTRDHALIAAIMRKDERLLPPCPRRGQWQHFKSFRATGEPRVGFSEAEAKADIARQGFHLSRLDEVAQSNATAK
jgi:hypothetical protein